MSNLPATYAQSGVNIEAGNELVRRIKPHAQRTRTPGVLSGIGGFGALFQHDFSNYVEPILVSSTDGVGTKLKIAFDLGRHDTVGRDLVAMCVNDLICLGAKPLFFLDYFATGKLSPDDAENVVKGIADGCVEAGCALIGGETAELPGFYAPGEYDLAGFTVGVVDKPKIIDGSKVEVGDAIIGLASSGLHSNGYSLARKILEPLGYHFHSAELGAKIGESLLEPTRIYVEPVLSLLENVEVRAIANITGGGFYENIPRALPENTRAQISRGSWPVSPLFSLIEERGKVEEREMFTTFNMGIGMVAVVAREDVSAAISHLQSHNIEAFEIGRIIEHPGAAEVELV
ncbi:MAG: phosphoribosylformylglycinamidine cyclo-ligase [Armatimonadetes bacterium]|nr:phosphoribosylformylglycinamidine cyclo-ligase [Armatimonadota bacterium]